MKGRICKEKTEVFSLTLLNGNMKVGVLKIYYGKPVSLTQKMDNCL